MSRDDSASDAAQGSAIHRARDFAVSWYWSKPLRPVRAGLRNAKALASPDVWRRRFTAHRRRLPEFVIVGAQKAGTTSLRGYLVGHPQCLASMTKEVHYFDRNYARGEGWYRMHFPLIEAAGNHSGMPTTLCFEASPSYMLDPRAAGRISRLMPGAKIILLLRNPVSRAYSHYQHNVSKHSESLPFEDALDAEEQRLAGEEERLLADPYYWGHAIQFYSYQKRGLYAEQLSRFLAHFATEQVLVLQAEKLFQEPRAAFDEVLEFLRLEAWTPPDFHVLNKGSYKQPIPPAARARLETYFAPSNERLFDLLGRRFDWS